MLAAKYWGDLAEFSGATSVAVFVLVILLIICAVIWLVRH